MLKKVRKGLKLQVSKKKSLVSKKLSYFKKTSQNKKVSSTASERTALKIPRHLLDPKRDTLRFASRALSFLESRPQRSTFMTSLTTWSL